MLGSATTIVLNLFSKNCEGILVFPETIVQIEPISNFDGMFTRFVCHKPSTQKEIYLLLERKVASSTPVIFDVAPVWRKMKFLARIWLAAILVFASAIATAACPRSIDSAAAVSHDEASGCGGEVIFRLSPSSSGRSNLAELLAGRHVSQERSLNSLSASGGNSHANINHYHSGSSRILTKRATRVGLGSGHHLSTLSGSGSGSGSRNSDPTLTDPTGSYQCTLIIYDS